MTLRYFITLVFLFILFISVNGFSFFNKKKTSDEKNYEREQVSDLPKTEVKYNNLYLVSKKYEEFLSENYGIQQENINHDVLSDF